MMKIVARSLLALITACALFILSFAVAAASHGLPGPNSTLFGVTVAVWPARAVTPQVKVNDQPIVDHTVSIAQVDAAQDGWIVIHTVEASGKPIIDQVVGKAQVPAGLSNDVKVPLTESFKAGDTLQAMLHVDEGTKGQLEFPGPDEAVQLNGQIVTTPFKILAGADTPNEVIPATGSDVPVATLIGVALLMLLAGIGMVRWLGRKQATD